MLKRSLQLFTAIALAVLLLPTAALPAIATSSIDPIFTDYYNTYEGLRVLGYPLTELTQTQGYPAQYFEKGRIEDHRSTVSNSNWRFMYGLLTAELMTRDPEAAISTTTAHYGDIMRLNDPAKRNPPPAGFSGGVKGVHDGMFVPFDPALRPAPGYVVAP